MEKVSKIRSGGFAIRNITHSQDKTTTPVNKVTQSLPQEPPLLKRYTVYTDGGCNNLSPYGEGGYAFVAFAGSRACEDYNECSGGVMLTTNNRMEMLAMCKAVESMPTASHVNIVSDSQYCIDTMRMALTFKPTTYIRANEDLIDRFVTAVRSRNLEVSFVWIRGHSGNKFNERCDELCTSHIKRLMEKYSIPVYNYRNSPKVRNNNLPMPTMPEIDSEDLEIEPEPWPES